MDRSQPATLGALALERARAGGDRPFLTFSDPETGERTELGHATFENWAAKTANLLGEDLGLPPGERVAVRVGGHWAAAVVAVAAWRAGLVVDLAGSRPAAVAVVREDLEPPTAEEVLVVGRGLGARLTAPSTVGEPFTDEVLTQADEHTAPPLAGDAPALVAGLRAPYTASHEEVLDAGRRVVEALGLAADDRLLCTLPCDRPDGLVAGPVAALVAGAAVLLVPGEPSAATWQQAVAERCTHALVADPLGEPPTGDAPPVTTCEVAVTPGGLAVALHAGT